MSEKEAWGKREGKGEKRFVYLCLCALTRVHTTSPAQRPRGEAERETQGGEGMLMVQVLGRR